MTSLAQNLDTQRHTQQSDAVALDSDAIELFRTRSVEQEILDLVDEPASPGKLANG